MRRAERRDRATLAPRRRRQGRRSSASATPIDRLNEWAGLFWGFTIVAVTLAVLYEVVARTVFGAPTSWGNETTIYLSAMAYLLAGGYALLHRRHVRIDVIYEALSPRTRARLDAFTFVFFAAYVLTLIWVRRRRRLELVPDRRDDEHAVEPGDLAGQGGDPAAGLLLLLQGISNLIRDLGWVPGGTSR